MGRADRAHGDRHQAAGRCHRRGRSPAARGARRPGRPEHGPGLLSDVPPRPRSTAAGDRGPLRQRLSGRPRRLAQSRRCRLPPRARRHARHGNASPPDGARRRGRGAPARRARSPDAVIRSVDAPLAHARPGARATPRNDAHGEDGHGHRAGGGGPCRPGSTGRGLLAGAAVARRAADSLEGQPHRRARRARLLRSAPRTPGDRDHESAQHGKRAGAQPTAGPLRGALRGLPPAPGRRARPATGTRGARAASAGPRADRASHRAPDRVLRRLRAHQGPGSEDHSP